MTRDTRGTRDGQIRAVLWRAVQCNWHLKRGLQLPFLCYSPLNSSFLLHLLQPLRWGNGGQEADLEGENTYNIPVRIKKNLRKYGTQFLCFTNIISFFLNSLNNVQLQKYLAFPKTDKGTGSCIV